MIGVWTPSDFENEQLPIEWAAASQFGSKIVALQWDVPGDVPAPGRCRIRFLYTKGKHGLDVRSVALLEDGVETVRDTHDGFTGGAGNLADYVLEIPARKPDATYAIRVEAAGRGGTDSYGKIVWSAEAAPEKP